MVTLLGIAERKPNMIKEGFLKMRAKDLHELLRAWENYHRIVAAEAHMRRIQLHEETRYPGYYYRMDHIDLDDKNWRVFVNSWLNAETGEWTMRKCRTFRSSSRSNYEFAIAVFQL